MKESVDNIQTTIDTVAYEKAVVGDDGLQEGRARGPLQVEIASKDAQIVSLQAQLCLVNAEKYRIQHQYWDLLADEKYRVYTKICNCIDAVDLLDSVEAALESLFQDKDFTQTAETYLKGHLVIDALEEQDTNAANNLPVVYEKIVGDDGLQEGRARGPLQDAIAAKDARNLSR